MEYPKTTKLGRNDITLGVILAPLLQPCLVVVVTWGAHHPHYQAFPGLVFDRFQ